MPADQHLRRSRDASAKHTRRRPHRPGTRRFPYHARGLGPQEEEEENAGYGGIISRIRGALIHSTHSAAPNWLGFARRYFTLYESGILSYAFGPGEPVRDQVSLGQAAISNEPCQYNLVVARGPSSKSDTSSQGDPYRFSQCYVPHSVSKYTRLRRLDVRPEVRSVPPPRRSY